jgi:beta-mannosidase
MAPLQRIEINEGWHFKQTTNLGDGTATSYLPVSQFPTVAHLDLLHHGLIKDPYIDTNELDSLWVNDANWSYRTTLPSLPISEKGEEGRKVELVFEGLDTICSVYLASTLILESKNMHISHRVDITSLLQKNEGKELELLLCFSNAPAYAKSEMKRIGYKGNGTDVHFGGPERLFVRKAQYHWGWDWGPALNTSGPWKPVYLEVFQARISEFIVRREVAEDLKTAVVKITGSVEGGGKEVEIEVLSPTGASIAKEEVEVDEKGQFITDLRVKNPELWWPFTHGLQPLYTITCTLPSFSKRELKIGFRRLRLLQHPLKKAAGTSFTFEINNTRIFCGGSCWIPGDYLLPRFTPQRYHSWLTLAKSGNQTMIRVWGGGIVESDDFYDICDREGILVWQDFLFACGDYPASDDFVEMVKAEAEQQVKRVGHHASLVIWAGNNEDYMLAERWGWEYDPEDQEGPWDQTNFPARKIYERVLPEICERLAGDVPYWRSSPYGGKTSNDLTVGDTHIWDGTSSPPNPSFGPLLANEKQQSGTESNPPTKPTNPTSHASSRNLASNPLLPYTPSIKQSPNLLSDTGYLLLPPSPFPSHYFPLSNRSKQKLTSPKAIPNLRRPRQRPRPPTPLRHVLGRKFPLPVQPVARFYLLFSILTS